jgi:hypothetical protein
MDGVLIRNNIDEIDGRSKAFTERKGRRRRRRRRRRWHITPKLAGIFLLSAAR